METILYTNSKREGSNYQADRITYAQRIDANQLIDNQMQKYNINRIHFWFLKDNINGIDNCNEETFLISIGKNLMDRGHFKFYYIVQKYRHNNKIYEKDQLNRQELYKQEIVFAHFKQYQEFIRKELASNLDRQIVKKYLFTSEDQSIAISLFELPQRNLVFQLVEDQCNQIYNAKLNYRKISTIHPQNYEKKKVEQIQKPIQMYHKLILYLFATPEKLQETQIKRRKTTKPNNANQIATQALISWKIKEQVQSLAKYQKQCELIKQQIENEKIIFRNKIKIIENYIGDSINVQKLYLQQEEVSTINQLNSTMGSPTFKKVPHLTKRSSISPAINQAITSNIQKLSKYNNTTNTLGAFLPVSEFKRLKDINEAMRNIDNTLFDQNKKIEQLKIKSKQLHKSKEQISFKQAKELNTIKKQLLELGQQMSRKQNQIEQKKNNGEFQTYIHYKNKQPSEKAKQNLKQHIKFLNNYQKPVAQGQHHTKPSHLHPNEISKNLQVKQKRIKQAQATLQQLQKAKQQSNVTIQYYTSSARQLSKLKNSSLSQVQSNQIPHLTDQLTHLYQYYLKNTKVINIINKEISNYKCLDQTQNKSIIKSKIPENATILSQIHQKLINLQQFPILKNVLEFNEAEEDCIPSTKHDKHKSQYVLESTYPKDCFELFINNQTSKLKIKAKEKVQSMESSLKDMEIDKKETMTIKPSLQLNIKASIHHKIWPKPSKFKRITIQQAIQTNSLMKKVVRINNDWQNL